MGRVITEQEQVTLQRQMAERVVDALHDFGVSADLWQEHTEVRRDVAGMKAEYEAVKGKQGFQEAARNAKITFVLRVLEEQIGAPPRPPEPEYVTCAVCQREDCIPSQDSDWMPGHDFAPDHWVCRTCQD